MWPLLAIGAAGGLVWLATRKKKNGGRGLPVPSARSLQEELAMAKREYIPEEYAKLLECLDGKCSLSTTQAAAIGVADDGYGALAQALFNVADKLMRNEVQ